MGFGVWGQGFRVSGFGVSGRGVSAAEGQKTWPTEAASHGQLTSSSDELRASCSL